MHYSIATESIHAPPFKYVGVLLLYITGCGPLTAVWGDWNWDGETITRANGFLYELPFWDSSENSREITIKLQMQAIDVAYAYKQVTAVVTILWNKWEPDHFTRSLLAPHAELKKPRIVGRQTHRSNPDVQCIEDYYRITLFDEFLSHVVAELKHRFTDNPAQKLTLGLLCLLPQ